MEVPAIEFTKALPQNLRADFSAWSLQCTQVLPSMQGSAKYVDAPGQKNIAWYYDQPTPRFSAIRDYLAFYPSKVDLDLEVLWALMLQASPTVW